MLSEIANLNIYPINVFEDNQSCIRMASTLESKRTKHIDIRYHFIKNCVSENKVKLSYIQTNEQVADIFTKQLAGPKFNYFRDHLNLKIL